jgi:hypothetical protein
LGEGLWVYDLVLSMSPTTFWSRWSAARAVPR